MKRRFRPTLDTLEVRIAPTLLAPAIVAMVDDPLPDPQPDPGTYPGTPPPPTSGPVGPGT